MTPLDTHELTDWIRQQLPDAHPLTDGETDHARLALRGHIVQVTARGETAVCLGERRTRRARSRRGRRGLRLGVVAMVATGAAVAVVSVEGSGSAISPAPARAAAVIAKARKALDAAPGSILEYQTTVQKGNDQPATSRITEDPSIGSEIVTNVTDQPAVTTATENGALEFYDPATNTIGRVSNPTPAETNTPTSAQAYADDLNRPGAQVDQNATYDGQAAVRISWPDIDQGTDVYYCAHGSYQPIAMLWNGGADSGGTTITWNGYRTLTGSAAATLTAQHPSAQIDEMPYSAWNAALRQLYK